MPTATTNDRCRTGRDTGETDGTDFVDVPNDEETDDGTGSDTTRHGPGRVRRVLSRAGGLVIGRRSDGSWMGTGHVPLVVWSVLLHVVVLFCDYSIISVTALNALPSLAATMHAQSGAADVELTVEGEIALWLIPFVFVVVFIIIVEVIVMRAMWRGATGAVDAVRRRRECKDAAKAGVEDADTQSTVSHDKNAKKRPSSGAARRRGRGKGGARDRRRKQCAQQPACR